MRPAAFHPGLRGVRRRGFTMVEAVTATIVLGLLSGAVLSSVSAAATARQLSSDRMIGRMLAEELLAEILDQAYAEPSNPSAALGPDGVEANGSSHQAFDDVDDYNGLVESPPRSRDDSAISGISGTGVRGWTRRTTVALEVKSDVNGTATSAFSIKRITVKVYRGSRMVASAEAVRAGTWTKATPPNAVQVLVEQVDTLVKALGL